MKHIHHTTIDSTSLYLKDHFKELTHDDQQILVSTNEQTKGRGRSDHSWAQPENSIAFSFTLKPCSLLTLTSLELGILLARFLKGKLYLKWPNDIINLDLKKCGGILCQLINKESLIIGIGLNLGKVSSDNYNFDYPIGSVNPELNLKEEDYKNIPEEIYQFILENRLTPDEIINSWNSYCFHKDKEVKIIDGETSHQGIFKRIDKDGAAILEIENEEKIVMCGSLFVNP
jgi:BirA family transcriptional regulator, biotin operon repressor / biotin---[acetyl-CoA-carboxylase] ligase